MLLGRVSRQERLDIVREVESQIFDQLGERGSSEPSRGDVLAVLAGLDPPEAYLPEDSAIGPASPGPSRAPGPGRDRPYGAPAGHPRSGRIPALSAIFGVGSLSTFVAAGAAFALFETLLAGKALISLELVVLFGLLSAGLASGMIAAVLSSYAQFRGGLSIIGLVTGILGMVASILGAAYLFFLLYT